VNEEQAARTAGELSLLSVVEWHGQAMADGLACQSFNCPSDLLDELDKPAADLFVHACRRFRQSWRAGWEALAEEVGGPPATWVVPREDNKVA
jgi:hypothetical protein